MGCDGDFKGLIVTDLPLLGTSVRYSEAYYRCAQTTVATDPGGASDANIRFSDLALLMRDLGFEERVRGSHHIFTREGIEEMLNLQPRGSMVKPYAVAQVRDVIVGYKLAEGLE
jgi:hypothetical protein